MRTLQQIQTEIETFVRFSEVVCVAVALTYVLVCCCKAHALFCGVLDKPRVVNCIRVSLYNLE